MPILYYADEDQPDVLWFILEQPYTWQEYNELAQQLPDLIARYQTTYIIIDSSQGLPSGNPLSHGRNALNIVNKLSPIRLLISLNQSHNPFVLKVLSTLLSISGMNPARYPIVKSYEAAFALIDGDRKQCRTNKTGTS